MAVLNNEESLALLALLIGDIEGSPFHPLFSSEQYQMILDNSKGRIQDAVKTAAITASMVVAGYSTKEQIGDFVIVNDYAQTYLKSLNFLMSNPANRLPENLMPWSANTGECQIKLLQTVPDCCPEQYRETTCGYAR